MEILIHPLDQHTLSHATALRDHIFPDLGKYEYDTLSASLFPEKYRVHKKLGINELNYWVASHPTTFEVIGLVGLYTQTGEDDGMIWLGWYCVDLQYRGHGIGSKLMGYVLKSSKEQGRQTLHLYTTDADEYTAARKQYLKLGFEQYKSTPLEVYYKLSL